MKQKFGHVVKQQKINNVVGILFLQDKKQTKSTKNI